MTLDFINKDRSIKIAGITALAILLLAGSVSAAPLEEWNRTFTGAGNAAANSVQQTADGGYIVAGITRHYSDGRSYVWLIKVSTEQSVSEKTPAASPIETLASNPTQALTAVQTETNTTTPPENAAGFEFVLAVIILLSVAWMRCYF